MKLEDLKSTKDIANERVSAIIYGELALSYTESLVLVKPH